MPRRVDLIRRGVKRSGFTIIELLVTVVIVSILATVAIPLGEMAYRRSKEQELRLALREIRQALDAYRQAGEEGHIQRDPSTSGYPPDLTTLTDGVPDALDPNGRRLYFLRRIPRDPFADATVPADQTWGLRSYESPPDKPEAGSDVFDVYSLASGTGLNGIPYGQW